MQALLRAIAFLFLILILTIDGYAQFDVNVTATPPTICRGQSSQLNASYEGGTCESGPNVFITTTYTWSPSTGLSANNISNPVASPTVTTTYSVTVKRERNFFFPCYDEKTVNITVTVIQPPTLTREADKVVCEGTTVQMNATASGGGGAPYVYQWTSSGSGVTYSNPNIANPTFTASTVPAGSTTVRQCYVSVYSNAACTSLVSRDTVQVTIRPKPTANPGANKEFCFGAVESIGGTPTATGGSGSGYTYQWTPSTGLSSATASNPTITSTSGTQSYNLVVRDGNNCASTNAASVQVIVNTLPTANAGLDKTICQNTTTALTGSASGGSGSGYSYAWTEGGSPATTASPNNQANTTSSPGTSNKTYVLKVTDSKTCVSAGSTVNVNVWAAPDAINDSYLGDQGITQKMNVLNNDIAVTPGGKNKLLIDNLSHNGTGTASVFDSTGVKWLQYVPGAGEYGVKTINYRVADSCGLTDIAQVTLNLNAKVVAVNDSKVSPEETTFIVHVLANDNDPDNDSTQLIVTLLNAAKFGTATVIDSNISGAIVKVVRYIPFVDSFGLDTLIYEVRDPRGLRDTAKIFIQITNVNDAPIAVYDTKTTPEDVPVWIFVKNNDSDVDDPKNLLKVTIATVDTPKHGTAVVYNFDSVLYTPALDYVGKDTFFYTLTDTSGLSSRTYVAISISDVNDAPVAVDDVDTLAEDTFKDIDVLHIGVDDSDDNTEPIIFLFGATPGSASSFSSLGAILSLRTNGPGNADDAIRYTAKANYFGADTFYYVITDGDGLYDTAQVLIYVTPVNDAPIAVRDSVIVEEDSFRVIKVKLNDIDIDDFADDLEVSMTTPPTRGTWALLATDSFLYTGNTNFSGLDSFQYTLTDTSGANSTAWVWIRITHQRDNPIAANDSASLVEDSFVDIYTLLNDVDPDTIEVGDSLFNNAIVVLPKKGSAVISGDKQYITYTASSDSNGLDSFAYQVSDTTGLFDTAWVYLSITAENDAPIALYDSILSKEDSLIRIDVTINDSDVETNRENFILVIIGGPNFGAAQIISGGAQADSIEYNPNPNFFGIDSFYYSIEDEEGLIDTAKIVVNVQAVNDPPIANYDRDSTIENTAKNINVKINDSDIDDHFDSLKVSIVLATDSPRNGTVSVLANQRVRYTPNTNYFGEDTFIYTLSDTSGATDTAYVYVNIKQGAGRPDAIADTFVLLEDLSYNLEVLINDLHTSNRFFWISGVGRDSALSNLPLDDTTAKGGTISILQGPFPSILNTNDDTLVRYVPKANYSGFDTFWYRVVDSTGRTDSAMVTLIVSPVNDKPIAMRDVSTTDEDVADTIAVLQNDTDPDLAYEGDSLRVFGFVGTPLNGTAAFLNASQQQVVYTPNLDFNGVDSFRYILADQFDFKDTAWVVITVNSINDAPHANFDRDTTTEDLPMVINVMANDSDDNDANILLTLSIAPGDGPKHGTATLLAGGVIQYTPAANYSGYDTFVYTLEDTEGLRDTANVYLFIIFLNDKPEAVNDYDTLYEDSLTLLSPIENDDDIDISSGNGDSLYIKNILNGPKNGVATIVAPDSQQVSYLANLNFVGKDTFQYVLSDTAGLTDTAFVYLTILAVNDTPVAVNDSSATLEEVPVNIAVLTNDSDVDKAIEGDSLYVAAIATQGKKGTATIGTNAQSIDYLPSLDSNGWDSFQYVLSDTAGATDTAWVFVNISPVNDAPIANNDTTNIIEEQTDTVFVLVNDYDVDQLVEGDSFFVSNILVAANKGTATIVNNAQAIEYIASTDSNGMDSFQYELSDTAGATSTAWVIINIAPVNDAPIAYNDTTYINEDATDTFAVLANDYDVDQLVEGDSFFVSNILVAANKGTATIVNNARAIEYVASTDSNGIDSFQYEVSDTAGATSTAWVIINIAPVNDAPVANNDSTSIIEEQTDTVFVLVNDYDVDQLVEGDSFFVSNILVAANKGTATIVNNSQAIEYVASTDSNGIDSFQYELSDTAGATSTAWVIINIAPINDAPIAFVDSASTIEDTAVNILVLANDYDVDLLVEGDSIFVKSILAPALKGNATIAVDGQSVNYTPALNKVGLDSFQYLLSDTSGASDSAWVFINIIPRNDKPEAFNDYDTLLEDVTSDIYVLANDTDPDLDNEGDSLFVKSILTAAVHGIASIESPDSQHVVYNPDTNYNGLDSFSYVLSDTAGLLDTAWVYLVILPSNDGVIAVNDTTSTFEEEMINIQVINNDTDIDFAIEGDSIFIKSIIYGPFKASVVVSSDSQSIDYFPMLDSNGNDSFQYVLSDTAGLMDTAWVFVNITPVNDKPIANRDSALVKEDSLVLINVVSNDYDVDIYVEGDSIYIFEVITDPLRGTVQVQNDSTIKYTPNANSNGIDSFQYAIIDQHAWADSAWVIITVSPVNDKPVAKRDGAVTDEETSVVVSVISNDTDVDLAWEGDSLYVFAIITNPKKGTASIEPGSQKIMYSPAADSNGLDSFQYVVSDTAGLKDSAWVLINIGAVNNAPVAIADNVSSYEDVPANFAILNNDKDADLQVEGDSLFISAILDSTKNGSVSITANLKEVHYISNLNFNGADSFRYELSDTAGLKDTAWVFITVVPVNDKPVATNDFDNTSEEIAINIFILSNDDDLDITREGDSLFISSISVAATKGTVSISSDKQLVFYTPNKDSVFLDSFQYVLSDTGNLLDSAWVYITIAPVNDKPVANVDSASTDEDVPVNIPVLANDSDVDLNLEGDSLYISAIFSSATKGSASISGNKQSINYTPNSDKNGLDSFSYVLSDTSGLKDTAWVFISISAVTDAPEANNDFESTMEEVSILISVLDNDSDVDENLEGDSMYVKKTLNGPTKGSAVISADSQSIWYHPSLDSNGLDSFLYVMSDTSGLLDTAWVFISIAPVNDAVIANNDSIVSMEDITVNILVMNNDVDVDLGIEGDSIFVKSIVVNATKGNASLSADQQSINYAPFANLNGMDSIRYELSDTAGTVDSAWVYISVSPVNDKPIANVDSSTTMEEQAKVISVIGNDTDVDIALEGDSISIFGVFAEAKKGSTSISPNAQNITYTPAIDSVGWDSFRYVIRDLAGLRDTTWVYIYITGTNDKPNAMKDIVSVIEDEAKDIFVLSNDIDADVNTDGDSIFISKLINNGNKGVATISADKQSINYSPNLNKVGKDSFQYEVSDQAGLLDTAWVIIQITPVNDKPVANRDTKSTNEDQFTDVLVLANDTDVDKANEGDSLHVFRVIGTPFNGSAVILGLDSQKIRYTASANYNGLDSFRYVLVDLGGLKDTAWVVITINPVNDKPIAVRDNKLTDEDQAVSVSVLLNDTDVDLSREGDSLFVHSILGTASKGTMILAADKQSITYIPNANKNGLDSFRYVLSDLAGLKDTTWVVISITPLNDKPVANKDNVSTNEEQSVVIQVRANDTDVDLLNEGDSLFVSAISIQGSKGLAIINANKISITYTPNLNQAGKDSFRYVLSDTAGLKDSTWVIITIHPINDKPLASNDFATINEDNSIVTDVVANDFDVDLLNEGDSLFIFKILVDPKKGTAVKTSAVNILYTPDANKNGQDTLTYVLSDRLGLKDTAKFILTIHPINDKPVALEDIRTISEDQNTIVNVLGNDYDVDILNEGDSIYLSHILVNPIHGIAVELDEANIAYSPNSNYFGKDSFSYVISDIAGLLDTAWVVLNIQEKGDAPIARPDTLYVFQDGIDTIFVLENDFDVDNQEIFIKAILTPQKHGAIRILNSKTIEYKPNPGYFGKDSFVYQIRNQSNLTSFAKVMIYVGDKPRVNAGSDQVLCNQIDSITLGGSPSAAGGNGGYTYLWKPSTGLSSATVANPRGRPSITTTYKLIVTDSEGLQDSDVVVITLDNIPVANYSYTPTKPQVNEVVEFRAAPVAVSSTYKWNFGDPSSGINNTSNMARPTHTYTQWGNYTVQLIVSSVGGCSDTINKLVKVQPPLGIEANANVIQNITMYPNPAKDKVVLDLALARDADKLIVRVINDIGATVNYEEISNVSTTYSHEINTTDLPAGFYFVQIGTAAEMKMLKLIIHK